VGFLGLLLGGPGGGLGGTSGCPSGTDGEGDWGEAGDRWVPEETAIPDLGYLRYRYFDGYLENTAILTAVRPFARYFAPLLCSVTLHRQVYGGGRMNALQIDLLFCWGLPPSLTPRAGRQKRPKS